MDNPLPILSPNPQRKKLPFILFLPPLSYVFPPIFPYFLQQKTKHFAIKFSFLYQYKQAFYQYLQGKSPLKPRLSHAFIYKTRPFFYGYPYRFPSFYANKHRVFFYRTEYYLPRFRPAFYCYFSFSTAINSTLPKSLKKECVPLNTS